MKNKAKYIVQVLRDHGYKSVFCGGYVRDLLLGKESSDIDIATSATPDQVEELFEKTLSIGKSFGIIVVIIDGITFEVATFRNDIGGSDGRHPDKIEFSSMEEDSKRRDFTLNGLFYDPIEDKVIDYVGGQEDIKKGIIKFIGNPELRINDDFLRLMRGIRFAVRFEFKIEEETFAAIKRNAHYINKISKERIKEEIEKGLSLDNASTYIDLLVETGIMQEIIPEYIAVKDVEQSPIYHSEGPVGVHTKLVLDGLKGCSVELKLAGLLHDIGKQKTTTIHEDGRIVSPGHAEIGAHMTYDIMKRLKFSNDITDHVVSLVREHMRIIDIYKWSKSKQKKFLAQKNFNDLFTLHKADRMGRNIDICYDSVKVVEDLIEKFSKEPIKPKNFVDGRDLIAIGFTQGKAIGALKSEIYDLQLEGIITDRESALSYAKGKFEGDGVKGAI